MLFNSLTFFVFLSITFILYYAFQDSRLYILAAADIVFYGAAGFGYLLLFMLLSFITYLCALKVGTRWGNLYFGLGVALNIINLVFFKYTGFILRNIENITNLQLPWQNTLLSGIILPIGISFYTFQFIAYLTDIRKGIAEPCKSLLTFWVFISFFAHSLAGPIMRANGLIPQIRKIREHRFDAEAFKFGVYYIILGLVKKVVFADYLAVKVDYYFKHIEALNTLDAWFAAYLFAFQIYFDFSAYSEIAVGIGYLLGIRLDLNFKSPYISGSPAEFWKRWHITLSEWIRDYVYIPLGGSRRGFSRQLGYLVTAMTLSGLWHGAAWTFVIWGLYHGILAAGHKVYARLLKRTGIIAFTTKNIYRVLAVFAFFQLANIGWVLFRAETFRDAVIMLYKMVTFTDVVFSPVYLLYFGFILVLYCFHVAEYIVRRDARGSERFWTRHLPPYARAAVYTILLIIIVLSIKTEQSSFIYFQF